MLPLTIRPTLAAGFPAAGLSLVHTWRDLSGAVCAYGYAGQEDRWIRWPGFAAFRFDAGGRIDAFPECDVESSRIADLCRRAVEPIVLQAIGWETLHASSVLTPVGLVTFCGERESGKSTLAYSLSRRGHRQRSDDAVVMKVERDHVAAVVLPFGVRLRHDPARHFGFEASGQHPYEDVAPIDHSLNDPQTLDPMAAIFVLGRADGSSPDVERLSGANAFTAILAHSHCFDPEGVRERQRLVEHYLEIASSVPIFAFGVPYGLQHLDAVLDRVEHTLGLSQAVTA